MNRVANKLDISVYDDLFDEFNLNDKQKLFVMRYCQLLYNDKWKTSAAKLEAVNFAGYTSRTPEAKRNTAYKLLRQPEVKAAIAKFQQHSLDSYADEMRMAIIEKLHYVITTFDPSFLVSSDGSLKYTSIEECPPEARWMIKSIETKLYGQYADRPQTTVEFHDVVDLMKTAAKILAMEKEIYEFRAKAKMSDGSEKDVPLINVVLGHEIS